MEIEEFLNIFESGHEDNNQYMVKAGDQEILRHLITKLKWNHNILDYMILLSGGE